jgi:hypothetical protein
MYIDSLQPVPKCSIKNILALANLHVLEATSHVIFSALGFSGFEIHHLTLIYYHPIT